MSWTRLNSLGMSLAESERPQSAAEKKSTAMKTIEVEIFGQRYVLTGDADEEYVRRCAHYVDTQLRVLAQGMKTATRARLAILAALNITHQLFQAERARQEEHAELERRTSSLVASIEEQLGRSAGGDNLAKPEGI